MKYLQTYLYPHVELHNNNLIGVNDYNNIDEYNPEVTIKLKKKEIRLTNFIALIYKYSKKPNNR